MLLWQEMVSTNNSFMFKIFAPAQGHKKSPICLEVVLRETFIQRICLGLWRLSWTCKQKRSMIKIKDDSREHPFWFLRLLLFMLNKEASIANHSVCYRMHVSLFINTSAFLPGFQTWVYRNYSLFSLFVYPSSGILAEALRLTAWDKVKTDSHFLFLPFRGLYENNKLPATRSTTHHWNWYESSDLWGKQVLILWWTQNRIIESQNCSSWRRRLRLSGPTVDLTSLWPLKHVLKCHIYTFF